MKWFVYEQQAYYPQAYILEAETLEEATEKALRDFSGPGYPIDANEWCVAVAPLDAMTFAGSEERIFRLLHPEAELERRKP